MKVKVKAIPVRHENKSYQPGETFDMPEKYIDENLVTKVEETAKKAPKSKEE